jgi:hypothetical protein
MISKEEFEKRYCENSDITLEEYLKYEITLPCACNYEKCEGWVAVSRNIPSIDAHMELYSPERKRLSEDELKKLMKEGYN